METLDKRRKNYMTENRVIRLTAAEMGSLWTSYMTDSMIICVLQYFLSKVEDTEIKPQIELAMKYSLEHIQEITKIFKSENFPIPIGFTEQDVNANAPRLYADTYFLYYLRNMAKFGLATNGYALSVSTRKDIMDFYAGCLVESKDLQYITSELMLKKGIYVRPPYMPIPKQVDFVQKKSFLGSFLGEQRPLTGIELSHLHLNHQNNAVGEALLLGFAQTANSEVLRRHFKRGIEISHKAMEVFQSILSREHQPTPTSWDTDVLDSQKAPFSDKLMLYHTMGLTTAAIGNYGGAMSLSMRRDLITQYARLSAEAAQYAEDSIQLIIEHGWMEQPPQAANRTELMRV
jgi:hypothetical protein